MSRHTNTIRRVSVFGSTGSVGRSTLDVLLLHPEKFVVDALVAGHSAQRLAQQALACRPQRVILADSTEYDILKKMLAGSGIEIAAGKAAVLEAARASSYDIMVAAIVGAAGLEPTMAAIEQGKTIALANKESLVCSGALMIEAARRCNATIVPVDSEHSAIFQVLDVSQSQAVEKLILTASGGPFRTFTSEQMKSVTPQQAVSHPNWSMGAKISIDSATMMNKGLEFIEAHYLFSISPSAIDIVVHPQSIIHSLVAYKDGSVLAQLGMPDMRTPIGYALSYPERLTLPVASLNLADVATMTFEPPDPQRFPALRLAREALDAGMAATVILNASNESAVSAFLNGKIGFLQIISVIEQTLSDLSVSQPLCLEDVLALDQRARQHASCVLERILK